MLTMQGGHRDVNNAVCHRVVNNEMLTMQGGHRDVNNAGWPLRDVNNADVATEMLTMQGVNHTEMLTMQGGHRDVNNAGGRDVNNAGWRC